MQVRGREGGGGSRVKIQGKQKVIAGMYAGPRCLVLPEACFYVCSGNVKVRSDTVIKIPISFSF